MGEEKDSGSGAVNPMVDPDKDSDESGDDNNMVDDTATESYDGESGDENSQFSYEEDDDGRPLPMPPLKYARIIGSLPRDNGSSSTALSVKVTSSAMGRVVVRPSQSSEKGLEQSMPSGSKHGERESEWTDYEEDEEADTSITRVHHVLALGFEDGKVRLVDVLTGGSVLFGSSSGDGGAWFVNPAAAKRGHDPGHKIVALSFDSSSSHLSALNANGDAAIFGPLVWGKQSQRAQSTLSGQEGTQQRLGFLASLAGKEAEATNVPDKNRFLRPGFTLVKPPASTVRFTYADPQSFGSSLLGGGSPVEQEYHPTCMAIDPAYVRRKERALIVGFDDGRLILSKLQGAAGIGGITSLFGGGGGSAAAGGGTTAKKVDSVLYQGMGATSFSGDQAGIEAVTWRGGLVAWADSSGVRLFDIETMSRIAHIDRPIGARSSLYPTISSLHPSILFEKSDSLLIGWGDCLMALLVRDTLITKPATKDGVPAKEIKRKSVEATMAWELDCVACSVVPVDKEHVAVLGLVPSHSSLDDSDQETKSNIPGHDYSVAGGDNVLELQLINRVDGRSISNDRLPLSEGGPHQSTGDKGIVTANAAHFCLLSSFAYPRMDGVAEWEALDDAEKEAIGREMRVSQSANGKKLPDLHLRWNLCTDICSTGQMIQSEAEIYDDAQSVASDCSVCSDNYVFVLSEPIGDLLPDSTLPVRSPPPTMAVIYSYDAVLVQTRDVDDVISYTRSLGKPALALRQALGHRRDVRRHGLDELVDEFFVALLRMGSSGKRRPLSIPRLKIAAESLPILLGGDSRMWQRWIYVFSSIPGGLFVIREKIPVRDPELPAFVFEMSLEKMLEEALHSFNGNENDNDEDKGHVGEKMAELFLETMRSWGPTSALRRRIQLYRYCAQNRQWGLQWHSHSGGSAVSSFIEQAEKDLQRRISQTAFGVLSDTHHSPSLMQNNSIRQYIDSSKDSLFDVENLITRLASRLHLCDSENVKRSPADYERSSAIFIGDIKDNSAVIVESMAELELMRERLDRALGYYLAIGSHFLSDSLASLEERAVQSVNSFNQNNVSPSTVGQEKELVNDKYGHVLSLIELHQLSHILLKRNFFFVNEKDDSMAESPIISLIILVGLTRAGKFLIDNCSPPEGMVTKTKSDENGLDEGETLYSGSHLPLDLIAKQMRSRPKLLYWFLFQVFIKKADIYVRFPTTAVPPAAITDLHQIQFSLFVDFSEMPTESNPSLATLTADNDTPFMAFLRAALPHGGVLADKAREELEKYRDSAADKSVFARELAFVIEKFGKGTEDDAKQILNLYIFGANNLFSAVAFAERNTKHSSILWDMLVDHCTTPDKTERDENQSSALGARFGSLLEAAAHTGSDLGSLVSRIPEGMSIEGLRPKLIAAITDYRHKVKIHEHVDDILMEDKISILRELTFVSRRGERMEYEHLRDKSDANTTGLVHKPSSIIGRRLQSQRRRAPSGDRPHAFCLPIR